MSDAALIREARRIHDRYQREVVETFVLCPFASKAREDGASTQVFVLESQPTIERVLPEVRMLAHDDAIEVAFIVFPRWTIERRALSHFVEAVRSAHQAEPSGLVMTMEGFHPDAAADTSTAGALVPFLRRTADPTIQLTRLSVLERVRASTGGTTKYIDPNSIDLASLLAAPPERSLHQRISDANFKTVCTHGAAAHRACVRRHPARPRRELRARRGRNERLDRVLIRGKPRAADADRRERSGQGDGRWGVRRPDRDERIGPGRGCAGERGPCARPAKSTVHLPRSPARPLLGRCHPRCC